MKKLLISAIASSFLLVSAVSAKDYITDKAHTNVGFKIKHLQVSNVKGGFDDFEGSIDFDPDTKKLNKFEANIKVASVNTKNDKRDDHLKSADFFEVEKYPEMKFVMTEFASKDGGEEGTVKGDLTIKGVTKPVELKYEFGGIVKNDKEKIDKLGFALEGDIDRTAFGVGEESVAIGSKVNIEIEVEANAK